MKGHVYRRSSWEYRFRLPEKNQATGKYKWAYGSGFATKKEAWQACRKAISQFEENRYVQPSKRTVAEYLTEWLPLVKPSIEATTWANWNSLAMTYVIAGTIGGESSDQSITFVPLQKLDGPQLLRFYNALLTHGRIKRDNNTLMYREWQERINSGEKPTPREIAATCGTTSSAARCAISRYKSGRIPVETSPGLAPKTVRNLHVMLHRAFADAVLWKYVTDNPAKSIKPPKIRRKKRPVWTPEQLSRFMDHIRTDRFAALFMLEITTALRRAEICGLRWNSVDLDNAVFSPIDSKVVVNGKAEDKEGGKTVNADRLIALDPDTVDELRRWQRVQQQEKEFFGTDYQGSNRVFTWEDGRDVNPDSLRERFKRLAAAADLPEIRFYDLRHSYVTGALRAGVRAEVVSERIGHASVAFTLSTYAHVHPSMDREAATRAAAYLLAKRTQRNREAR